MDSNILNGVFDNRGCSVDGSVATANPFIGIVNSIFDSSSTSNGVGLGSSISSNDNNTFVISDSNNFNSQQQQQHLPVNINNVMMASQGFGTLGMGMESTGPFQPTAFQPTGFLSQMNAQFYQQNMMLNMVQQQQHMMTVLWQQQQQQQQYQYQQQQHSMKYENNSRDAQSTQHTMTRNDQESDVVATADLETIMMRAINNGEELSHDQVSELWDIHKDKYSSNEYEGMKEEYEKLMKGSANTVYDNNDVSAGAYNDAWDRTASKLEALDDYTYQFNEENPFADNLSHSSSDNKQRNDSNNNDDLFEKGMSFFKDGDIKSAINAFEAELQASNQSNDESWRMLGICHMENDLDKIAIHCLKKSLDCDPYNLNSLLALGISYVNELNPVLALDSLRKWVSHNPRYAGIKYSEDEYSDGTLMDEIMQLMTTAQRWSPDDYNIPIVLGVLFNVSSDYDNAVNSFYKASNLINQQQQQQQSNFNTGEELYSVYNKIGASLANANQSQAAIDFYRKSLEIRPRYVRGCLNMGIAHANQGDYTAALKYYLHSLELNPTASHIYNYMRVALTASNRLDLVQMCNSHDVHNLRSLFL